MRRQRERARAPSRALIGRTGDPDQLFARLPGVESWRSKEPGSYVISVSDPRVAAPEVTRCLVNAGADVLSIAEAQHSLEDVYLELIADDAKAHTA